MATQLKDRKFKILGYVQKIFGVIRLVLEVVFSILRQVMTLIVFFAHYIVQTLSHPTMPAVVSILVFLAVVIITGLEWWSIGLWLMSMAGVSQAFGLGGGMFGLFLGFGTNVFQLSPELWKLQPLLAKAYSDLKIDPDAAAKEATLPSKLGNWLTHDHGTLKGMRLMSYCFETGLVVAYTAFAGGFAFGPIVQAAFSLLVPEWSLKGIAATTGVTRATADKINEYHDDADEMNKFGF